MLLRGLGVRQMLEYELKAMEDDFFTLKMASYKKITSKALGPLFPDR